MRLWQVEFKVEDVTVTKAVSERFAKIIVKTKLGTQDVAQFTVDNIIKCLKDNGYGELLEELGQEALDNYFDMRQGKAESIQDYIFRGEILTVALQKDTAIDLDEKIRGYWLMRTSNLTERELSGIKIITQGQTELAQVKKAITQTIVAKKREEVRDDLREAGDRARDRPRGYAEAPNFHLHGNSVLLTTKSRRFYPKGGGRARSTGKSIEGVEESDVVQPMWCYRSLGRRLLTACQKPQEEIPSAKGKGKSRRFRREKSDGKGRGGSSNYPFVEVYNDGSKNQTSHMKVPPGYAVLDCGAATSLCGAKLVAQMAQTCAREGKREGDKRDTESIDESYHFR